jgi:GAF domain-containing protein
MAMPHWEMMSDQALQRVTENLLLVTGASRALLQLARGGGFAVHAEAVQHAQPQLRHHVSEAGTRGAEIVAILERERQLIVQPDIAAPGSTAHAAPSGVRAQMLAPLTHDGRLAGVISLHATEPREWSARDQQAMLDAQSKVLDFLQSRTSLESPADDLRSAAVQAILDRLRIQLDVQRCTFRQPVQAAYAFPVTFESRAEGMRSLLGDFTIVQTGQPVIVRLLAERAQVIQDDCNTASADPLFHKMLAHYGGMRAQMVTPFIVGDQLKGVLSVHALRQARTWTSAEKTLAAEAAFLIGTLLELSRPRL